MIIVEYYKDKERIYVDKTTNFIPVEGDTVIDPYTLKPSVVLSGREFWPARQLIKVNIKDVV